MSPRIADGSIAGGHGNLTAVGRCRVARPGRRHADAMDEAIPAEIYNASRLPPISLFLSGRAECLGCNRLEEKPKFTKPASQALRRSRLQCIRLGCASIQARKA